MAPASSAHGLYRIFLPIGWRTLILRKKPPMYCTILVWIAGGLEFFKHSTDVPSSKEQLLTFPLFWSSVWWSAEEVRGLDGFLYEAAQNLESFQKFKIQIKKSTPIEVDVLFKAYPMVPLPCRSNLGGRYLIHNYTSTPTSPLLRIFRRLTHWQSFCSKFSKKSGNYTCRNL